MSDIDLSDPRPEFLTLLDSNRQQAIAGFRRFAERLFEQAPPPNYFRVPADDREDVFSDVVLHCIDNDCARLRKFKPRAGCAFAGWFAVVASRKISDFLRQRRSVSDQRDDIQQKAPSNPGPPNPEQIAIKRELEGMFLTALRSIGRRCRLLLRLKMLEYKNREIVQILRLPKDHNKAVGNQVIECRRKLIRHLEETGFFRMKKSESG